MTSTAVRAQPPAETLEGWYALHQIYQLVPDRLPVSPVAASDIFGDHADAGWSIPVRLVGSTADVMFVHFRPTLDALGEAQRRLACEGWMHALRPVYSFLSVAEAGMYHLTAGMAKVATEQGWEIGGDEYRAELARRLEQQRQNSHVRRRLYPDVPEGMPYVSFYPMNKRRAPEQNWYALSLDERSRLLHEHGNTGRRYAGRVSQIITGAIGFDLWEWGVTLFASDPLDFKKLVTEMRYDEASAHYAEFGQFWVGRRGTLAEVLGT